MREIPMEAGALVDSDLVDGTLLELLSLFELLSRRRRSVATVSGEEFSFGDFFWESAVEDGGDGVRRTSCLLAIGGDGGTLTRTALLILVQITQPTTRLLCMYKNSAVRICPASGSGAAAPSSLSTMATISAALLRR